MSEQENVTESVTLDETGIEEEEVKESVSADDIKHCFHSFVKFRDHRRCMKCGLEIN